MSDLPERIVQPPALPPRAPGLRAPLMTTLVFLGIALVCWFLFFFLMFSSLGELFRELGSSKAPVVEPETLEAMPRLLMTMLSLAGFSTALCAAAALWLLIVTILRKDRQRRSAA